MKFLLTTVALLGLIVATTSGQTPTTLPGGSIERVEASSDEPYLLHLPGVGGYLFIDRTLMRGLRLGGVKGTIEHYDWTVGAPGFKALTDEANKKRQVEIVCERLRDRIAANPDQPITLTAHSGGCAIAVWALEGLPESMQIERLIFIAPALSPGYDLSAALVHVRGKAFVFSSEYDEVLGAGTRLLGTMDGVKTDAAGKVGFFRPADVEEKAYGKLVAMPYEVKWVEQDNAGDHIGPMSERFAREVIAPLVVDEGVKR